MMTTDSFLIYLLAILTLAFLSVQFRTFIFERKPKISFLFIGFLVFLSLTTMILAILPIFRIFRFLGGFFILLIYLSLLFGKVVFRNGFFGNTRELLRASVRSDLPYERFTTETSDSIKIFGYFLHDKDQTKSRLVILAHGGLRSKDIFVKHLLASWLFKEFDVISFDFRGHGESEGVWEGGLETAKDLEAIINFAKQMGYQRIGIYGRSLGGWTAVHTLATQHSVSALVIAGMPPGNIVDVPIFRNNGNIVRTPIVQAFIRIISGTRLRFSENNNRAIDKLPQVSPVPILIIYNKQDPTAGVYAKMSNEENNVEEHFPFTLEEVFDSAREPKRLLILSGKGHVYDTRSLRVLFTEIEKWFNEHL